MDADGATPSLMIPLRSGPMRSIRKSPNPRAPCSGRKSESRLRFSAVQLDAYGIKELHVLEQVLRAGDRRTEREVSDRIRKRIDWDAPLDVAHRAFLQAYYAGLRERLETRMVVTGKRRADKFDR